MAATRRPSNKLNVDGGTVFGDGDSTIGTGYIGGADTLVGASSISAPITAVSDASVIAGTGVGSMTANGFAWVENLLAGDAMVLAATVSSTDIFNKVHQ